LSCQFNGLADGCERICDALNFDLISLTVSACPDPAGCNTCCENDLFQFCSFLQEWFDDEG